MRLKNLSFFLVIFFFLLTGLLSPANADIFITGADGYFKTDNFKAAFKLYDDYARKCEKTLGETEVKYIFIKDDSSCKDVIKKTSDVLSKSFYCYYRAGYCLEKLGKSTAAIDYYIKALHMCSAAKAAKYVNLLNAKAETDYHFITIEPRDLGFVYDRIYAIGAGTETLVEKIRYVAELRRDLAKLIENNIDVNKQPEYRARFAVCQKSEKNLCILLENFVNYEINRYVFTRFDEFVKCLNSFKPVTPAADGVLDVARTVRQNLMHIIADSQNPASEGNLIELNNKLSALIEIINYMEANRN